VGKRRIEVHPKNPRYGANHAGDDGGDRQDFDQLVSVLRNAARIKLEAADDSLTRAADIIFKPLEQPVHLNQEIAVRFRNMDQEIGRSQAVDHASLALQNAAEVRELTSESRERRERRTLFSTSEDYVVQFVDGDVYSRNLLPNLSR